jgi:hypothetical protein
MSGARPPILPGQLWAGKGRRSPELAVRELEPGRVVCRVLCRDLYSSGRLLLIPVGELIEEFHCVQEPPDWRTVLMTLERAVRDGRFSCVHDS